MGQAHPFNSPDRILQSSNDWHHLQKMAQLIFVRWILLFDILNRYFLRRIRHDYFQSLILLFLIVCFRKMEYLTWFGV